MCSKTMNGRFKHLSNLSYSNYYIPLKFNLHSKPVDYHHLTDEKTEAQNSAHCQELLSYVEWVTQN